MGGAVPRINAQHKPPWLALFFSCLPFKGKIARALSALASGAPPAVVTEGHNPEETEKRSRLQSRLTLTGDGSMQRACMRAAPVTGAVTARSPASLGG
jgi:hypothetical protein